MNRKNIKTCMCLCACMLSCFNVSGSLQPYIHKVAHQAPVSMGFSRQEYWSELPCLPPGDLPTQGSNLLPLYHIS